MTARELSADEVGLPRFATPEGEGGDVFALSSHARAREALEFALAIPDPGYNLFVVGPDRSGRMTATLAFLNAWLADRPVPDDWIFLNNFRRAHRPRPLRLPAGTGRAFRDRMEALIPRLRESLQEVLGSEEHHKRLHAEGAEIRRHVDEQVAALREEARPLGLDIAQTQQGPMVVATGADGQPANLETLPADQQEARRKAAEPISERLGAIVREAGRMRAELEDRVSEANWQAADAAVAPHLDALMEEFGRHRGLGRWLTEMRVDLLDNLALFAHPAEDQQTAPAGPELRYAVNLLVDHGDERQPTVVLEGNPSYQNLFGRIEYRQVGGMLDTDFTLIRAGALHRANGGILVLRADSLAADGPSWEFLKGALRDGRIELEELYRAGGVPVAGAPRPKPIPLDLKVVIVGAPNWYYTFFTADPQFQAHFKVKADIDADMEASPENLATYAGLMRRNARRSHDRGIAEDAVGRLLSQAARWAEDRHRLSAQFERVEDVITEAASLMPSDRPIDAEAVERAIAARRRRNARIEDRIQDQIRHGTVMIDTSGEVVGQINALTVRDLGDHAFGAPSRITARASVGRRGLINIERDVALGGPIQQKGAMVIQGFLSGHFARRAPLSFNCSITFEQSYGGVEGDSASLAELVAVLSDLAGLPIRQSLAITGSVNQRGQAQAIGGVTHKIEGFFRTCRDAGKLDGRHGVVVPSANERHIVLREELRRAVADGSFRIYAVRTVEDALALFTGAEAGEAGPDGRFPPDSVYGRVTAQIEEFDRILAERERG